MASVEASWKWVLVTAIAPVAWGSNYYVTRQFLPAADPLWGAVIRAVPAGILLLIVCRRLPTGSWWWRSVVLGVLNVGAFFVLVYVAAQLLPSGIAATIMASSAIVLLLLAWPLVGERPTIRALAGAVVGLAGVCVLLWGGNGPAQAWGVAASLAAMLMSSLGYLLTKRWAPAESPVAVTSWQLLAGGILVVPFAAVIEGPPPVLTAPAVLGFGYVTVVATALAFAAWFAGLRHLPAGTVGLIGLLNPLTGVLLGTLLAGEEFGAGKILGGLLVIGGLILGRQRALRTRTVEET